MVYCMHHGKNGPIALHLIFRCNNENFTSLQERCAHNENGKLNEQARNVNADFNEAAVMVSAYIAPFLNRLNSGNARMLPYPVLDVSFFAAHAFNQACALLAPSVRWSVAHGRIQRDDGARENGVWVQSSQNEIADFRNEQRPIMVSGGSVAQQKYDRMGSHDPTKASQLVSIWRGVAPDFSSGASKEDQMVHYSKLTSDLHAIFQAYYHLPESNR